MSYKSYINDPMSFIMKRKKALKIIVMRPFYVRAEQISAFKST